MDFINNAVQKEIAVSLQGIGEHHKEEKQKINEIVAKNMENTQKMVNELLETLQITPKYIANYLILEINKKIKALIGEEYFNLINGMEVEGIWLGKLSPKELKAIYPNKEFYFLS